MRLDEIKSNLVYKIIGYKSSTELKRRLNELGFSCGAKVSLLKKSILKKSLLLNVDGANYSLKNIIAKQIIVSL